VASHQVVEIVRQIALPVVQEAGMELVDVEFLKEGGHWYLRIFIDKPEGIDHEDCRFVSERIDRLLDEKDPIPHSYTLEVSSPGIERPIKKLEDYNRFMGKLAVITTFAPVNGRKKFSGRLLGTRMGDVAIDIDGAEFIIPLEQIASARLAGVL
jgi:ribosome maturation factor RimP